MHADSDIADYYQSGDLLDRLGTALAADGIDPAKPTVTELATYDHFHGRGLEATAELAGALSVEPADHILDIGSGIGGPARYIAERFSCRVTGIDLTAEFCDVARRLTDRTGQADKVSFECANALAMPFEDASFDGAYSMNVAMNIADKTGFYREISRVLKPHGWFALSELARGPGPDMDYPTPWADTAASSFLATIDETRSALAQCGFAVEHLRETAAEVLAFADRSREIVAQGDKPPHRAVQLIHGERARQMAANVSRGVAEQRVIPIEVLCRRA